jgi:hypothetical protein
MKENIDTKKTYVIKGEFVLGLVNFFKTNLSMDKAEPIVNDLRNLQEVKQETKK